MRAYEIEIEQGILFHQEDYLSSLASQFALITDDQVAPLYGIKLHQHLTSKGLKTELFSFSSGERYKTRATKEHLEDQLFEKGFGKDICIIALGGGVVTDMAGYLASTYCRGVPLVMIPTSLLAMVDASIGGKTGVNVAHGKNLIGSIYQPKKVVIDPLILKSLPKKEISHGFVEMIKHALIADASFFEYLESNASALLTLDLTAMKEVIFTSCRIKKEIVEQDEKESGKRRLLNFGHTLGHALEKLTEYSLSHGEAVAIGILTESYLSVELGALPHSCLSRIKNILLQYGLPLRLPQLFSEEALLNAMTLDKKSLQGHPRFVILDNLGSSLSFKGAYCTHVSASLLKQTLEWMNSALYLA